MAARKAAPRSPLKEVSVIDLLLNGIAIDLVGPITPTRKRRYRYILSLNDYATQNSETVPLKNIDTEKVAKALLDVQLHSCVDVPEEVLSDLGKQFVSECTREVTKLESIKRSTISPYHLIKNGLVEKIKRTLKKCGGSRIVTSHVGGTNVLICFHLRTEKLYRNPLDFLLSNCYAKAQ